MPSVTFQILEGIDKGRVFRDLPAPLTIGREEGNQIRLNDERVSRYHAKIQADNNEIILTDLESTNGTRVNGCVVQIRRLKPGDSVTVGRSLLLFGSEQEIAARMMATLGAAAGSLSNPSFTLPATVHAQALAAEMELEASFDLDPAARITTANGTLYIGPRALPPLPQKLTPSQAARLSEILDFLHRHLTNATQNIRAADDLSQVTLSYADWQRILGMQMVLARYARAISDPDSLEE